MPRLCEELDSRINTAARPKSVAIISWFTIICGSFSAIAVASMLSRPDVRVAEFPLTALYFLFIFLPLFVVSCAFMLKGKGWARQLYVALGVSTLSFTLVAMPITSVTLGRVVYFVATVILLFTNRANAFFSTKRMQTDTASILVQTGD